MFFLIPVWLDNPLERRPIANWVIVGLNILVFLFTWHPPDGLALTPEILPYTLIPSDVTFLSLITHAFLHDGFFHIAGNMLFLFLFGNNINARLGHLKYTICYLLFCLLAGSIYCLAEPGSIVPMIGASGAICGITAMSIIWYPKCRVLIAWFYWLLIRPRYGTFWAGSIWVVLIWLLFDVWGLLGGDSGVAYAAHLGGYGAGVAIAYLALFSRLVEREGGELFTSASFIALSTQTVPFDRIPDGQPKRLPKSGDYGERIRRALPLDETTDLFVAYHQFLADPTALPMALPLEKAVVERAIEAQSSDLALLGLKRLIRNHPEEPAVPGWKLHAARIYANAKRDTPRAMAQLEELVQSHPDWEQIHQVKALLESLRTGGP